MAQMIKAFTFAFDGDSLAKIRQFSDWQPMLEEELKKAHDKADAVVQVAAKKYAPYQTGELVSRFGVEAISPYESAVFNDSPYAWRREEGFSGMTDSLGRFYPNDPGKHYMYNGLMASITPVGKIFGTALDATLARLGVK